MTAMQAVAQPGASEKKRRTPVVTAKVTSSMEEMQMIVAIRAQVFLGHPGWDYKHTFDENDHCATHVISFVDGEPAATMRIRWFAEFARFERLAVREPYRSFAVLNSVAKVALRLCRRKGYQHAGGLIYPSLIKFWGRNGAHPVGDVIPSELGELVPVLGCPPEYDDIVPLNMKDAGNAIFELDAFSWEGRGL